MDPKKNMRGGATGGGTAQAKSKPPAPPKLARQTSKETTRVRALFKKKLSDADIDRLLGTEPSAIIQIMSDFEKDNKIDNLEKALGFKNTGGKSIRPRMVKQFSEYLRGGLPSEAQLKSDLDRIKGGAGSDSAAQNLAKFFSGNAPAMAPDIPSPVKMTAADLEKRMRESEPGGARKLVDVTDGPPGVKVVPGAPGGAESRSSTPTTNSMGEDPREEMKEDETPRTPPAQTPRAQPAPPTATATSTSQSETPSGPRGEPFVLPTAIDSIPPARLSSSFKSVAELNSDIRYFLKNFATILKPEAAAYKKVDKKSLPLLIRLHSRIVGKLSPKVNSETGKKIGVVLDAKAYIAAEVKRLMQESTFSQMRPDDVVVDVGQNDPEQKDVKDIGDFEVKRSADGGLSSRRESIYRYAPTEGDPAVGLQGKSAKQKKKPRRLNMLPAEQINQSTTAQRLVKQNPFLRSDRRTNRLIYLS